MPAYSSPFADVSIPTNLSLPEFIIQNYSQLPQDRKLLIDPLSKRSYTPPQVIAAIKKVAAGFHKKGLKKGDVVALYLPNIVEYPIIMYGIQSLGGIPSTINPLYTTEEITHQLKDCNAQFIITIPQLMDKVNEAKGNLGGQIKEVFVFGEAPGASPFTSLLNNDGKFPAVKYDPRTTVAVIPYSSGTTGLSKGVELTHYNIVANILQIIAIHDGLYHEHEVLAAFLPFFHIYGMVVLLGLAMKMGFTLVVLPKFDLPTYLKVIQEYKATILHVVPPVVVLLNKDPSVTSADLSSVRAVISGAAPLGADTEDELRSRINSNTVTSQAAGSIGQLLPNMKFKVVDTETGQEVGPGKVGELWVTGPNTMKGYLNNPKATSITIDKDGFLHTGDIVHLDDKLNVYVVDRLKELIKYKGFQVAPAELEALLLTHPDVADAAVIGKPDKEAGELPMAFVVLKKGHTVSSEAIISWAEKKTAPHKKLRGGVVLVESVPKSASGKILRRLLKAKL